MKDDLFYLPIQIGGVELRNPFVVASGPTTKRVDQLQLAERSGWAAASIKQTFNPAPYMNYEPRYRWLKKEKLHTFTAEYRLDMEQGLRLVEEARKKCKEMVIIANYSYVSPDLNGWQEAALRFEAAGAQMLELNLCCPNMSFNVDVSAHESKKGRPSSGASMGQDENSVRLVIEKTREVTNLPLIAKITPEGGRIAEVSKVAYDAGAAAVCSVANRLGIPPIDIWNYKKPIYNLQGQNTMGCLSGPWIKPLALRDVYEIRRLVGTGPAVIGTGGVASWEDAVEMMMCGADSIGVCTQIMLSGFRFLEKWMRSLKGYMKKMGFQNALDLRDLLLQEIRPASELTIWAGYAHVDPEKCSSCGLCVEIGHCNAIMMTSDGAQVDSGLCSGCSTCIDICTKKAITICDSSMGGETWK
jgi:dihydroorotate dehydrogenase/Pyruvate/2-oxoacid:ferredoxin oxidoreductase delta subunit